MLVRVLHTTICGAQINEIEAVKGPDKFLPHLLGHEASATVMEIGPGVTHVAPGDTVVMHWRPGRGIQSAAGCVSLARREAKRRVGHNVQRICGGLRESLDADLAGYDLKLAPLFGCAVTTAAGVINNDAHVKIGESVVVFGVGGVGLNVVQFAQLAGAHPIIAVDLVEGKLEMAKSAARHILSMPKVKDVDAEIRKIVGSSGADKVVETTGVKSVIESAYNLASANGTCVLVGVP